MALFNPPLREALLCFSAAIYRMQNHHNALSISPDVFLFKAIQNLVSMGSNTTDIHILLATTAMSVFLYLSHIKRSHNLFQFSRSTAAYLSSCVPIAAYCSEPDYQTVMSLLRWADISTLCSLKCQDRFFKADIHQLIELHEYESQQNFSLEFCN